MKHKYLVLALFSALTPISALLSGEFKIGPEIEASDLAAQLGIHASSLTYSQATTFSKLDVGLNIKERKKGGEFETTKELLYIGYSLPEPTKEQTIKVFVSEHAASVIVGPYSSRGKGIDVSSFTQTNNPPMLIDGKYILEMEFFDPSVNTIDTIKRILEITVEAR